MIKKIGTFCFADKIPNLALEKIALYYQRQGYTLFHNNYELLDQYEKIFISIIFDWDIHKLKRFKNVMSKTVIGGSAIKNSYDLPPEVEMQKPQINMGYTTRGCIRKCKWCSVHEREPAFKIVGDLYDLWDRQAKDIILLDNNILAKPEHFKTICKQALKENIRLNFYQGLDHRLLTDENCKLLREVSHKRLRFSFDQSKNKPTIIKAINLLKKHNLKLNTFFVLVGFNETFKQDLERVNLLKEMGQDVYIARYNYTKDKRYIPFCKWVNNRKFFNTMTFKKFLKIKNKTKDFLKYWK